ncbi:MAG TPA: tRNA glutamyl-Q(34) synthetase GluQRS [Propionibacteriaceae bacterium]|nr:tRNA glutamyl-Q(34) synthetase GluQRS [Propionibacteriaceae bacterium]
MGNPAGRFAPSPTSDLHLGNLRTALLSWLFARASGLDFVVRVEDLDQQRVASAPDVAARQLADLASLGLDWDGEVVRQSERHDLYTEAASTLDTYECFCTRREVADASQAPHGGYRPYPGTCSRLSDADRSRLRAERPAAIRVRAGGASSTIHDVHAGEVTARVDDFVLFRNDRTPAYNLAVVVDDALQGVVDVCRGDDLLTSAPRQAWLARTLGHAAPTYVHVGMAVNSSGRRLAKRDGAVTLADLASAGASTRDVMGVLCRSLGFPDATTPRQLLAGALAGEVDLMGPRVWEPWVV